MWCLLVAFLVAVLFSDVCARLSGAMEYDDEDGTAALEFARGGLASALLPEPLLSRARTEDPARFDALVDALTADWAAAEADSARVQRSLRWVSLVNWCVTPKASRPAAGAAAQRQHAQPRAP